MEELPNLDYIKKLSVGDLAFEEKLIGVIKKEIFHEIEEYQGTLKELRLGKDGDIGLLASKKLGGLCIVQNPVEAESSILLKAALALVPVAEILKMEESVPYLHKNTK